MDEMVLHPCLKNGKIRLRKARFERMGSKSSPCDAQKTESCANQPEDACHRAVVPKRPAFGNGARVLLRIRRWAHM